MRERVVLLFFLPGSSRSGYAMYSMTNIKNIEYQNALIFDAFHFCHTIPNPIGFLCRVFTRGSIFDRLIYGRNWLLSASTKTALDNKLITSQNLARAIRKSWKTLLVQFFFESKSGPHLFLDETHCTNRPLSCWILYTFPVQN